MANLFGSVAAGRVGRMVREGTTLRIEPPEECDSLVVIMHGLGDTADGFADVAQMFSPRMPKTRFILPTAPRQPVTLNRGMIMTSWYDIVGLGDRTIEECEGIEESAASIREILDKEHASSGIPYNRMVVAGFSQGGSLSLYLSLQQPAEKKLAGVLAMSGYLAGFKKFKITPGVEDTPILHQHGMADPMVQFKWAEFTRDKIRELGATGYELDPYRGLTHSVSPDELANGLAFLQKVLPALEASGSAQAASTNYEDMSVAELKAAIQTGGLGTQAVGLLEKEDLVKFLKENQPSKDEL